MIENMTNEQAAECLKTIHVLSFKDETATFFLTDVQNAFKLAIQALEQVRPKGKWSRPSVVAMPYSFAYECPICRQWGNIQTFEPNYCPNCGADMRGEGDE